MTAPEENALREARNKRIRRVKRWLRFLPRRATIHRYPILRRFAHTARRHIDLWSFREQHAVPAIYVGCVLTFLPLYGIQILLAFLFALRLRANLPILAGLQLVSNPITVLPIWFSNYQVGRSVLGVLGVEAQPLRKNEVQTLLHNVGGGDWGPNLDRIATVFGVTTLGGIVMGTFFGLVASLAYRIVARRTAASYVLLRQKIHQHKARHARDPANR